jgi:methionyl-tRNA formyltransferase
LSGVFLGTDSFAAAVLRDLAASGRAPDLVITRPDAPKGRGRRLEPPPVASEAVDLEIDLIQPISLADPSVSDLIDRLDPPALSLCAYGAIVREPLLSSRPILNLHPSLLPRWRGAAPIERALMAGDSETGVSIIRLVAELDAGPIWAQERLAIEDSDDFESLSGRLRELGSRMLGEALDAAERGDLEFTEQNATGATYAERIEATDRLIDPSKTAIEIERQVRALRPHIGARLELASGITIGVREAVVAEGGMESGSVVEQDRELVLGCADQNLKITRLVAPGGREMESSAWLRGRPALT